MKKFVFYMAILLLTAATISCGKFDFWDTFTADNKIPSSILFIDVHPDEDYLTGDVIVGKAADETNVASYKLYWGSSAGAKLSSTPIATLPADGTNKTFSLNHLNVPAGATHFIAVTANAEGDLTKSIALDFEDLVVKMEVDIRILPATTASSNPLWLTEMGGKLYFFADTGDGLGSEFLSYDPATPLLPPVQIGNSNSFGPLSFAFSFDGWVYFKEDVGVGNRHLFRYDGVNPPVDISALAPVTPDLIGIYLYQDSTYKKLFFFEMTGELYSFDLNTSTKSSALTSIGGTPYIPGVTKISSMNGFLYFSAGVGAPNLYSYEISTDTLSVPLESYTLDADAPGQIITYKNNLYFGANNDASLNELWMSDGSVGGATRVSDINAGGSSNPFAFFIWNNYLYFIATDGTGNELYVTDGSTLDFVYNRINTNSYNAYENIFPLEPNIKYFNNKIYMRANDDATGTNNELWVSDGITSGDTHIIMDLPGDGNVRIGNVFNNKLFFKDGSGYIWFYNSDIMSAPLKIQTVTGVDPSAGVIFNNKSYFAATNLANGRELWVLYYK